MAFSILFSSDLVYEITDLKYFFLLVGNLITFSMFAKFYLISQYDSLPSP